MLQMDSSAHPIVVGGTYLGLEGAAPERVIPLLDWGLSIGACRLGLVDWGLLTRSAPPKTRLRPQNLSASLAMRLHRSLDELDDGSPLERLFKESDRACF
jgi:hypothetical protein